MTKKISRVLLYQVYLLVLPSDGLMVVFIHHGHIHGHIHSFIRKLIVFMLC